MLLRNVSVVMLVMISLLGFNCTIEDNGGDDIINKFTGIWNVNDQAARINYKVNITGNPSNSSEVFLNNFADMDTIAIGLVVGNTILIDSQKLRGDYTVSGSGNLETSSRMVISFILNDGIDSVDRKATFTR